MAKAGTPKVRLTLDVTAELNERLNSLADEAGGSKSELLRKAIALVEVALEAKRTGRRIAIVDKKGRLETTIVGL